MVNRENVLKHLGLLFDVRLDFVEHINAQIKKVNKGIIVIRKLHLSLPRVSLLAIYKSFVRPHLDYGMSFMINLIMLHYQIKSNLFNIMQC